VKRAALVVVLLVLARTAAAAPTPMITPPAGWTEDPERSAEVAKTFQDLKHFGGKPVTSAGQLFLAPDAKATLVVTRATLRDRSDLPASSRAAIDEMLDGPTRAAKTSRGVTVISTAELQGNARQYTAVITWQDAGTDLNNTSRLVLEADAERLVAITGECLTSSGTPAAVQQACKQALQSLDSGIPPDRRVEVTVAEHGAAPAAQPAGEPTVIARSAHAQEPARLTDGTHVVLPPMAIPADKAETDRRPIYIGGGLVVMAIAFWFNRRRREQLDRADATARGEPPAEPGSGDDDGDDLHAAARGDGSRPKDDA
jgi:hypothetical protein